MTDISGVPVFVGKRFLEAGLEAIRSLMSSERMTNALAQVQQEIWDRFELELQVLKLWHEKRGYQSLEDWAEHVENRLMRLFLSAYPELLSEGDSENGQLLIAGMLAVSLSNDEDKRSTVWRVIRQLDQTAVRCLVVNLHSQAPDRYHDIFPDSLNLDIGSALVLLSRCGSQLCALRCFEQNIIVRDPFSSSHIDPKRQGSPGDRAAGGTPLNTEVIYEITPFGTLVVETLAPYIEERFGRNGNQENNSQSDGYP